MLLTKKGSEDISGFCSYTDSKGHTLLYNIFWSGAMSEKSIYIQGEQLQAGRFQNTLLCLFLFAWFTLSASLPCALADTEKL